MATNDEHPWRFDLGEEVRDRLTGFTGNVDVRAQYLHGVNTYRVVAAKRGMHGEVSDIVALWMEEGRLLSDEYQEYTIPSADPDADPDPTVGIGALHPNEVIDGMTGGTISI